MQLHNYKRACLLVTLLTVTVSVGLGAAQANHIGLGPHGDIDSGSDNTDSRTDRSESTQSNGGSEDNGEGDSRGRANGGEDSDEENSGGKVNGSDDTGGEDSENEDSGGVNSGNGDSGGGKDGGGFDFSLSDLTSGIGSALDNSLPDWLFEPLDTLTKAIVEGIQSGLHSATKSVANGVNTLFSAFNSYVFGIPAPGDMQSPSTWTDPADAWWAGMWKAYWLFAGLGIIGLLPSWMLAYNKASRIEQRKATKDVAKVGAHLLGGWIYLSVILHLSNGIILTIAPSGTEFLKAPVDGVTKMGLGIIVALGLILIDLGVIVIGFLITHALRITVYLTVGLWPLFIIAKSIPHWTMESAGNLGMSILSTVIAIKIFQVAILRALYSVPLRAHPQVFEILLVTVVVLAIVFLYIPKNAFQKLTPAVHSSLNRQARAASVRAKSKLKNKMDGKASEHLNEFKESVRGKVGHSRVGTYTSRPSRSSPTPETGQTAARQSARSKGKTTMPWQDLTGDSSPDYRSSKQRRQQKAEHARQRQREFYENDSTSRYQ